MRSQESHSPESVVGEIRRRVKKLTGRDRTLLSLPRLLEDLNPILRGWGYFYRFCTNANKVLVQQDWYVRDRLWRWMRKKYPEANAHWIASHRKPSDTGKRYVESFHGKLQDELLNGELFDTLWEAQVLLEQWRREYNAVRPHSALGYRPPAPETWSWPVMKERVGALRTAPVLEKLYS